MSLTEIDRVVNPISLSESEVRFYKEEGYLPLPGFLDATAVGAVRDEIHGVLEANGVSRDELHHVAGPAGKLSQCSQYLAGSALDTLINSEATLGVASRLIGGPAVRYLPFTAVKAGGGGGALHFHQDNNYTRHEPAMGSINIWVALVDMSPANGCLQIARRSHLDDQRTSRPSDDGDTHQQVDIDPLDCTPMRMRAGDAVAFSRWTVHGSGANTTAEPRIAYALQYHRADVRALDPETGHWTLLTDNPRFATPPLTRLGPGE